MYGLIVKLTVVPGTRQKMVAILKVSAANMPGCLSYVVAEDSSDPNALWVTEVWDSEASHTASLSLPAVKNAIPQSKAIMNDADWNISQYEIRPDRLVVYLWPKAGGTDFDFTFRERYEVNALTAPSVLYDYYNPDARTVVRPTRIDVKETRAASR